MHENSKAALKEHGADFHKRYGQVLGALSEIGPANDKQIAKHLGYADFNKVRPRITELRDAGVLEELPEKIKLDGSRVAVRLVRIKTAAGIKTSPDPVGTAAKQQPALFPTDETPGHWGF